MPSLDTLSSPMSLRDFARQVAASVEKLSSEPVDVNGGVKTTDELKQRLIAGRSVSFDYDRLIDESKSYK
jgi:hypothetical protein